MENVQNHGIEGLMDTSNSSGSVKGPLEKYGTKMYSFDHILINNSNGTNYQITNKLKGSIEDTLSTISSVGIFTGKVGINIERGQNGHDGYKKILDYGEALADDNRVYGLVLTYRNHEAASKAKQLFMDILKGSPDIPKELKESAVVRNGKAITINYFSDIRIARFLMDHAIKKNYGSGNDMRHRLISVQITNYGTLSAIRRVIANKNV